MSATPGVQQRPAASARGGRSPRLSTRNLAGKTAVVTGAGSGIGRSLATLLAGRGAAVHVVDRDGTRAQTVAGDIRDTGGHATAHTVDVTDPDAVTGLARDLFADGPVDLLFNNAGIGVAATLLDTTLEDWHRLIDVNLLGVVHGVNAFLGPLLDQGRPAHIMNTASMAGLVPAAGLGAYSATKAAVVAFTEALDIELIGTQVRVSALCPGVIDTAIVGATAMHGVYETQRSRTADFYATRGTSPDVVARQALSAVDRGRRIVPTPRYQTVPHWLLKRVLPPAGRRLSVATYRFLGREG